MMNLLLPTLLILGLFALVSGFILSALMRARRDRRAVEARTLLVRQTPAGPAPATVAEEGQSGTATGRLAPLLRRFFTAGKPYTWGMHAGTMLMLLLFLCGAALAWVPLVVVIEAGTTAATIGCLGLGYVIPRLWLQREQAASEQKFQELLPDTIDMAIRMLRAGMPIGVALRAIGAEAPPPVSTVFSRVADQMAIGIPFEVALSEAGEIIGLADFRFFAVATALQRATGGNLTATLDILSDIMRKRRAVRLKAKAATGEVRMSAYILGAMPFLIIGALVLMSPQYMQPLITDRRGNYILMAAAGSLLLGFGTMHRMMRSVTRV